MTGFAVTLLALMMSPQTGGVTFSVCGDERRITCVVDGDTFWLNRVKYRIADIDAPEVGQPECRAEAEAARRATYRLLELLNAGQFEVRPQGLDRYDRTLATVWREGRSIGAMLVQEGHARQWGDRRGWC